MYIFKVLLGVEELWDVQETHQMFSGFPHATGRLLGEDLGMLGFRS